jgi:hypothetical protein
LGAIIVLWNELVPLAQQCSIFVLRCRAAINPVIKSPQTFIIQLHVERLDPRLDQRVGIGDVLFHPLREIACFITLGLKLGDAAFGLLQLIFELANTLFDLGIISHCVQTFALSTQRKPIKPGTSCISVI